MCDGHLGILAEIAGQPPRLGPETPGAYHAPPGLMPLTRTGPLPAVPVGALFCCVPVCPDYRITGNSNPIIQAGAVMIQVWANGGRICVRAEGELYASRVRVDQLACMLTAMIERRRRGCDEQRMGQRQYPGMACPACDGAGQGQADGSAHG